MSGPYTRQAEAHPQVLAAEHVVQVRHGIDAQRTQLGKEAVQSADALMPSLQVSPDETDIRRHPLKQRTHELPAQHSDAQLRMLTGAGVDDRDGHCHIAQRREAYDEQMFHV